MEKAKEKISVGNYRTIFNYEADKIYQESISYKNKQFICIACGEYVSFVKGDKYRSYFKHSKENDETIKCDERCKNLHSYSIYEIEGLPLYIKKENNLYKLYIGFYPIKSKNYEKIEEKEFIIISSKLNNESIKYLICKRFSNSKITLLELDFLAPKYIIEYSTSKISNLLNKQWGFEIEGFSNECALFINNSGNGRKLRINEEIITGKEYLMICKTNVLENFKEIIKITYCSQISLKKNNLRENFSIYIVIFNPRTDKEFIKLENLCRDYFKLFLTKNNPVIDLIWPPMAKIDNQLFYINNNEELFFLIESEKSLDYMYLYGDNGDIGKVQCKRIKENNFLVNIPSINEFTAINLMGKYNVSDFFLSQYFDSIKSYENSIIIQDELNNIINSDKISIIPINKRLKVTIGSKCRILHLKSNRQKLYEKSNKDTTFFVEDISFNDELTIISSIHNRKTIKFIQSKDNLNQNINEEEIFRAIIKYNDNFINTPIWIKKILFMINKNSKLYLILKRYIISNKIPLKSEKYLKRIYMKRG